MVSGVSNTPWKELLSYGNIILEGPLSKDQFIEFSTSFPELLIERESNGSVIIMSPVKKGSGKLESLIQTYVGMWCLHTGKGEVYSSSTGIELPDGSIKSPDCAWVSDPQQKTGEDEFVQNIPEFIVEIRSSSDSISKLRIKMEQVWMANGVLLAWLINPYEQIVWIYRKDREVEKVRGFEGKVLSGEKVLPGLEVPMDKFVLTA